ncbi:hypothetical protein KI387_001600 [Taxus chinensis]|uniref:FAS1 domain-containing protein n=1 Tax=Taxus chinensis TaxID=29808 RepID=A0AA38GXE4_TAXCH|nr:hypothetical protein KI387_001600 [Taxus chinensis]
MGRICAAAAFSVLVSFLFLCVGGNAHNITAILDAFPEYSTYNDYLTRTKLADEINSRTTITVLVVNNGAMAALTGKKLSLAAVKNAMSLLVLLDYFNGQKLHDISNGTALSTTLYQTTGNAVGNGGFLNITDLKGGKVGFGAVTPGSKAKLDAMYVKSVKEIPYNVSVLEISQVILPSDLSAPAPSANALNVSAELEKAGCKIFVQLITDTGVLKTYEDAITTGLTLFAPTDEAFAGPVMAKLKKLSSAQQVSLLEYHAMPVYNPTGTLKTASGPMSTLATNGVHKYAVSVSSAGDTVTLDTGLSKSTITKTLVDDPPVALYSINKLLLPSEIFAVAPAPAPTPETAPSSSPTTSPEVAPAPQTLTPTPSAASPSPTSSSSPPAPPSGAPLQGPASSQGPSSANSGASFAAPRHEAALGYLASMVIVCSAAVMFL